MPRSEPGVFPLEIWTETEGSVRKKQRLTAAQSRELLADIGKNFKTGEGIAAFPSFACGRKKVGKAGAIKTHGGFRHIEISGQLRLTVKCGDVFFGHRRVSGERFVSEYS